MEKSQSLFKIVWGCNYLRFKSASFDIEVSAIHVLSNKPPGHLSLVKPANPSLGHNFAICDMHLKPSHREPSFLRICKVDMVWIDNTDEVRILSHAQVVLDVFENNLNDRITVRDVSSREMTAVYLL